MIKVCKFGGSSMANAEQFQKVKQIVLGGEDRRIVVVSALGKRVKSDIKITDLLYTLRAHLKYNVPYDEIWNTFYSRFTEVKATLNLKYDIEKELNELKANLKSSTPTDFLVSRGEYFTARLISEYLGYTFVDAKDLIIFDYNSKVDYEKTMANVKEAFEKYGKIVVPGFYGSFPNGTIKIMSRGGSDITGSILAKSVNATVYENWTDVSGVYAADPRIVDNPLKISEITYAELRELSYMGANVLHEETIFPVQDLQIPINIKNTNDPSHPGTMIKEKCESTEHTITGIAGKKDFMAFNISLEHMSGQVGFIRKVLSIFEKYNVNVEHIPSGIDSLSVVCSKESVGKFEYEIVSEIRSLLDADVSVDDDLALVAVVGRNMARKIGLSAKIFTVLAEAGINIKMVDEGPTEFNIIIGIKVESYEEAIRKIYKELID